MDYPEETIAINKQGKKEVRVLQEKGQYVKYNYLNLETGKKTTKYSLILKNDSSKEHLMVVPLKTGKSLVVEQKKEQRELKILDEKKKKTVEF
ncbi:hypothetical protein J4209_04295 [Candidatus Woesearchaeota archaeon]|nr:hypothetical protein [Candidatus Woesearchaeota archaeon]